MKEKPDNQTKGWTKVIKKINPTPPTIEVDVEPVAWIVTKGVDDDCSNYENVILYIEQNENKAKSLAQGFEGRKVIPLYPVEALAGLDEENFELKAGMALYEKALDDKDKQIEELKEQIETINGMIGESESGGAITTGGNIPATKSKFDEATKYNSFIRELIGNIFEDGCPDEITIFEDAETYGILYQDEVTEENFHDATDVPLGEKAYWFTKDFLESLPEQKLFEKGGE